MFNRVDKATKIFLKSLTPYMEKTLLTPYIEKTSTAESKKENWQQGWLGKIKYGDKIKNVRPDGTVDWDLYDLITTIHRNWDDIFTLTFRSGSRVGPWDNISKLYDLRNIYAHQRLGKQFTSKDVLRFLDNAESFVRATGDAAAADEIDTIFVEHALEIGKMGQMARVKEIEIEFKNAESMRSNPVVHEYLEQELQTLQNDLLPEISKAIMSLKISGKSFRIPVAIINQSKTLTLGHLATEINIVPAVAENAYIRKRNVVLRGDLLDKKDNRTYALDHISVSGDLCTLAGSVTTFLSVIATHTAIEHELLSAAYQLSAAGRLNVKDLRPLLVRRAAFCEESATNKQRFAGIGLSTALVFNTRADGYKVLAGTKRSMTNAVGTGLLHVIPSCMFQALKNPKKEWDIQHCIIREYSEELFGMNDDSRKADPHYIYDGWPSAKELRAAICEKRCELIFTGILLDLFNLKPEICFLLIVHDSDWFERHRSAYAPNDEFESADDLLVKDYKYDPIREYHIDTVDREFTESIEGVSCGSELSSLWFAPGLAAFWLGVDAARKHPRIRPAAPVVGVVHDPGEAMLDKKG